MNPTMTHLAMHVRDMDAFIEFYQEFCGMVVVHERRTSDTSRVVWLAEPGKEKSFIFVIVPGGDGKEQALRGYSHLGFACSSRSEVGRIAEMAKRKGCLVWAPREEPYPVGYYCGVRDPDGGFVEFSYGQPLGPGAEESVIIILTACSQSLVMLSSGLWMLMLKSPSLFQVKSTLCSYKNIAMMESVSLEHQ